MSARNGYHILQTGSIPKRGIDLFQYFGPELTELDTDYALQSPLNRMDLQNTSTHSSRLSHQDFFMLGNISKQLLVRVTKSAAYSCRKRYRG